MPPIIFVIIFVIHSFVFSYLYLKHRHFYHLIFTAGFLCLIIFYWAKHLKQENEFLSWVRIVGIGLCLMGTPFLIRRLVLQIKNRKPVIKQ